MDTYRMIVRFNENNKEIVLFSDRLKNELEYLGLLNFDKLYTNGEFNFIQDEAIYNLIEFTFLFEFESKENKNDIRLFFEKERDTIKYAVENHKIAFVNPIARLKSNKRLLDPLKFINHINFRSSNEKSLIIAVLDSGVFYHHQYLKNNLWNDNTNTHESYGYNYTDSNGGNIYDVLDEEGHGTHIAGILVSDQYKNVNKGIAGDAQVISMKVKPGKPTYVSDICQAFKEALTLKASVINNSWYIPDMDRPKNDHLEEIFKLLEKSKCIPVFAAGNQGIDVSKIYPLDQHNIIVVGSMNYDYSRVEDSNWGENITIWAPGENISSTGINNSVASIVKSGTSMAAPYVTGVISRMKEIDGELDICQIKELLQTKKKHRIDKPPFCVSLLNMVEIFKKLKSNTIKLKK